MRISTSMIYDQMLRAIQGDQAEYSLLSGQLATQKKILSPSQDVVGTMRAMDYRLSISSADQYRRNIEGATNNLTTTNTALSSFSDALNKVFTMVRSTISGAEDPTIRSAYALQADQFGNFMKDLANTKVGDRYLFAGFRTNLEPYDAALSYTGDNGQINVLIDSNGTVMPINVPGSDAFSLTPTAVPTVTTKTLSNNMTAQYTQTGTSVQVDILDATSAVVDTFNFSNAMQLTSLASAAIGANTTASDTRLEAMIDPLNSLNDRVRSASTAVAVRLTGLHDQAALLSSTANTIKDALSFTEDADLNEVGVKLQQVSVTLEALRSTAAKILSQSLLDFLK